MSVDRVTCTHFYFYKAKFTIGQRIWYIGYKPVSGKCKCCGQDKMARRAIRSGTIWQVDISAGGLDSESAKPVRVSYQLTNIDSDDDHSSFDAVSEENVFSSLAEAKVEFKKNPVELT